ncbi:MAG TPA: GvpL/GvpF family gas vesicle protein [Thermoanaerobaculia bacterium]|nr:GvpL/GvpF family gas vesicle protein [Thermoanaerobaculia bacterium]
MKSVVIGAHLQRDDVEPIAVAIPVSGLFLSAVAIADDRPLGDRDLLLQVADVRARLLDRATFVAIRYGFAVHDAREAETKCASRAPQWRALLLAHRDEVEMTLKVAASAPAPRPDRHDFTSGADYLRALHASASTADIDQEFREAVEGTIVPLATSHRWSHRDRSSLELSMLVPRSDLEKMRAAGEKLRSQFPKVPFLLSGPWPLEVFADDHQQ